MGAVKEIVGACTYGITLTVSSKQQLLQINEVAKKYATCVKIHIKIDTGMSRLGIWHEDLAEVFDCMRECKYAIVQGIYTHFHSADALQQQFTYSQIKRFNQVYQRVCAQYGAPKYIHAANSMGLLKYPQSYYNLVRPGLMIYGLYPNLSMRLHADID